MFKYQITLFACGFVASCSSAAPSSTNAPNEPAPTPGRGPEEVVPASALEAGACDDAPLLTLDDMDAGKGNAERIAIDVVPAPNIMCTLLACYPASGSRPTSKPSCCNQCGGGYGAQHGETLRITFVGFAGCRGMDCNLHCEPFGLNPRTTYRIVGKNNFSKAYTNGAIYNKSSFIVEKYCLTSSRNP